MLSTGQYDQPRQNWRKNIAFRARLSVPLPARGEQG
jgi:hypothetical protein